MIVTISGANVPKLFRESVYKTRLYGNKGDSRNGPVRSIREPVILSLWNPEHRVLTDPVRDANPFFHVMEFIWMMAGSNDIQWISQFNKQMLQYSDDGKTQHAAYGYRWRKHFDVDQVKKLINMIRKNVEDRRLVLSMWDARVDLGNTGKDVPCNTQAYFRIVDGMLNMYVMNRSNDLIWGALGANIVHMTMLHELIARAAGVEIGEYSVFTTNLHIYESVPNFDYYNSEVLSDAHDVYRKIGNVYVPLLQENESYADFVADCIDLVHSYSGSSPRIRTFWMRHVGSEIYKVWLRRKLGLNFDVTNIVADDWRIACDEWISRRNSAVGNFVCNDNAGLVGRQQAPEGVDSRFGQSNLVGNVDRSIGDLGAAPTESGADGNVSQEPF
jgi:thymidylate synthase